MNWLKKGPELKAPSLEVPAFLSDLFYDMRERRLLPLLALAIVAIIAVPFLLGDSEDQEEGPSAGGGVAATSKAQPSSFTVVESKPGLRDYHERLSHRSPTNPFKQRFTNPTNLEQAQLQEPGTETSVTTEEGSSTVPGTSTEQPGGTSPGAPGTSGIVFFDWAIDVEIKKAVPSGDGSEGSGAGARPQAAAVGPAATEPEPAGRGAVKTLAAKPETTVRHKILPQTPLPSPQRPVAVYMGRSHAGRPLFLVSEQVKGVFGESQCLLGGEACQLIEMPLNLPVTFVWANNVRYTFNVHKIELVVTGRSKP